MWTNQGSPRFPLFRAQGVLLGSSLHTCSQILLILIRTVLSCDQSAQYLWIRTGSARNPLFPSFPGVHTSKKWATSQYKPSKHPQRGFLYCKLPTSDFQYITDRKPKKKNGKSNSRLYLIEKHSL